MSNFKNSSTRISEMELEAIEKLRSVLNPTSTLDPRTAILPSMGFDKEDIKSFGDSIKGTIRTSSTGEVSRFDIEPLSNITNTSKRKPLTKFNQYEEAIEETAASPVNATTGSYNPKTSLERSPFSTRHIAAEFMGWMETGWMSEEEMEFTEYSLSSQTPDSSMEQSGLELSKAEFELRKTFQPASPTTAQSTKIAERSVSVDSTVQDSSPKANPQFGQPISHLSIRSITSTKAMNRAAPRSSATLLASTCKPSRRSRQTARKRKHEYVDDEGDAHGSVFPLNTKGSQ